MRKLFCVALIVFTALAANAQRATEDDILRFCRLVSSSARQQQCMSEFSRTSCDLRVLEFCGRMTHDDDKLLCGRSFIGKSYSDTQLIFCLTRPRDADRISCLLAAPSTTVPTRPTTCESRRVRVGLEEVLTLLQRGQTYRAEQALREVLAEIE